jgi:hypothetical protein
MNAKRLPVVLLAALLLAGCGDRRLILKVDVLSFLDPSQTTQSFDVPALISLLWLGERPLVDDMTVNLFEGLSSAADVGSITITASTIWTTSTGSGADTVRVYFSDENTPPRSTPPAIMIPVTLVAGRSDTVTVVLGDDPRIARLFGQKRVRMSVTNSVRGPLLPPDLTGTVRLGALDAVAIATRKP